MLYKLKRAATLYPETVQLFSAHSFPKDPTQLESGFQEEDYLNNIPCWDGKILCEHPVVKITNFRSSLE